MEQNCLLDNWRRSSSASMECSGCGEGGGYTYSRIYSPPNCVITCYLLFTRTAKVHRLHCISPNHVKCAVYWASKSGCSSTARGMLPLISDVCDVAGSTLMQHKLGTDKIAHKTSTEMTPDSSEIMAEAVSPCFTYLIVFYQHRGATLYIGSVRFRSFNKNRLPTMQVSFSLHVPTWSFFREILINLSMFRTCATFHNCSDWVKSYCQHIYWNNWFCLSLLISLKFIHILQYVDQKVKVKCISNSPNPQKKAQYVIHHMYHVPWNLHG